MTAYDLEFARRAKVRETPVAKLRRWQTSGGRFAVIHVRSLFGLPPRWLAVERCEATGNERVISRHKTRAAAEAACRQRLREARRYA
jgi:hypothetical protein